MVSLDNIVLCDSMSIFTLMYDTPPNPFDFSFKAIILGTTLHSHLSLWQTETNRIPFIVLTAKSSVYQDCKSLSVFCALFVPIFCAVNRLQTGQSRNWYERFFSPPKCSDHFWCPAIWCSGLYRGLLVWH